MDLITHYIQIVLLGIVEGVTEFLPISSTGHLLIAEHFLGSQEPDIFNVVIQAGAILAVVFIYWHKIVELFANLNHPEERDYLAKILVAFLVTTALVLLVTVKLKLKLPEELAPVAWATLIGGIVIFVIEWWAKNLYAHDGVTWFESVLIGAAQVVAAAFPGASRSGSTIMAGMAVGMKRPAVTQFTFLVGIPTMFAASVFDVHKNWKDVRDAGSGHQLIIDTVIGFLVSMVVAFFVVKWLLRFVQSHNFIGFAIYRVILGGGLLIGLYSGAIPDVGAKAGELAPGETPVPPPILAPASPATPAPAAPDTNAAVMTPNAAPMPDTNTVTPAMAAPMPDTNAVVPAMAAPMPDTNAPVPAMNVPSTDTTTSPAMPATPAANMTDTSNAPMMDTNAMPATNTTAPAAPSMQ